jgi:hypothetical protein
METLVKLLLVAAGAASAMALDPRQGSDRMASVDLAVTRGKPEHRASGFIYDIPDNFPNQIPLHWYTDMGITSCKGGGAQLKTMGWTCGPAHTNLFGRFPCVSSPAESFVY